MDYFLGAGLVVLIAAIFVAIYVWVPRVYVTAPRGGRETLQNDLLWAEEDITNDIWNYVIENSGKRTTESLRVVENKIAAIDATRTLSRAVPRLKADARWATALLAASPILVYATGYLFVQPVPQLGLIGVVMAGMITAFGILFIAMAFTTPSANPSLREIAREIDILFDLSRQEMKKQLLKWGEADNFERERLVS